MRYLLTLDTGAPGQPVNLGFAAAYVLILNPTAKTLYVRVGGNDTPATADQADITCPAAYAMAWPVAGRAFGLGFGLPQLAIQPDGMPTTATLYFCDGSEPLPAFGPMPLDTLQAAITNTVNVSITNAAINATITNSSLNATVTNSTIDVIGLSETESLIYDSGVTSGALTHTLTPPAGTHALVITGVPPTATKLNLSGVTSGNLYLATTAPPALVYRVGILDSLDASYTLAVTDSGAYQLRVYAYGGPVGGPGDRAGVPLVRLSPGNGAAVASFGQASAPAAFTTLVTSGPLPAGRYRVVAGAYSDDTPGVGKRIVLIGSGVQAMGPVGAQLSWDWPDIAVAANGTVFMQNAAAGSAGTFYTGWLLLYLIS